MKGKINFPYLSINEKDQGLGEMASERGREGAGIGAEQVGNLAGEIGELVQVEGGDVGKEHSEVAEVLGDNGVGGGDEGGLTAEEVEG